MQGKPGIEYEITPPEGNVFSDLGLADPEGYLAKSCIASKIAEIIEKRHLSQSAAAEILCIPQSKVSTILNGKLHGISLEKLCNLMTLLGRDVEIVIRQKKQGKKGTTPYVGHVKVTCV